MYVRNVRVYDLAAYLHRGECELCHVGESRAADSTRDGTRRVPGAPKRHSANFPRPGIPSPPFPAHVKGAGGRTNILRSASRDLLALVKY